MDYILETNHLIKKHGTTYRVKDVNLHVPEHSVYGFLGPNGAGKTTTLKLILGLIKPDQGDVSVFGQKVTTTNRLSILRRSEIVRALKTVRLYEQRDKKLKNYSLGMRQRLGLAMALLGDPKLLILDEPTNGLDPAGIQEIRELIRSLPQERDMTVVVSSHLLNEVEQMADHVGIIHHGEMLYQGPLPELEKAGGNLEDVFLLMTGGGESL